MCNDEVETCNEKERFATKMCSTKNRCSPIVRRNLLNAPRNCPRMDQEEPREYAHLM